MLFGIIRYTYISCTMRWEVSLVGRNTITHGGIVGPATRRDSVLLSETTNWSNCSDRYSVVRCSILNRKSGVDFLLDSPMILSCSARCSVLFDSCSKSGRKSMSRCAVGLLSLSRCCRCSLFSCSMFGVLLFSLFGCSITQNFQDFVPHEVHGTRLRCQLKASPLFIRFLEGVASVSCVGASVEVGGAYRWSIPWETGSNRFSRRKWAAREGSRTVGNRTLPS